MTVFNLYVPEPEGHTWDDWACAFINANPQVVNIPQPFAEQEWREWAQQVCVVAELLGHNMPWPSIQPLWPDWVHDLSAALVAGL